MAAHGCQRKSSPDRYQALRSVAELDGLVDPREKRRAAGAQIADGRGLVLQARQERLSAVQMLGPVEVAARHGR
jgi:hypothetical protein